jgi:hypothetical protein
MTTTLLERLTDADEAVIASRSRWSASKIRRDRRDAVQPNAERGRRFVVGRCQDRNLQLRPWECPPFRTRDVDEPSDEWGNRPGEVALLKRMLRAGVSRFHPDPMAAIEAAEQA